MFKKIVQIKLKFFARAILRKYDPKIVGITGSVGKTSAKEACFAVLKNSFRVRKSIKNYNNEFGLPLAIIGEESAGRNIFGWILIFLKAFRLLILKDKNYPEILILEMGVDKPGDMKYLLKMAKPDVGILTMIGPSHLENFKEIANIKKEKSELLKNLKNNGLAVLNADNEECLSVKNDLRSKVLTFGFCGQADVKASNLMFKLGKFQQISDFAGVVYKLNFKGSAVPIALPRSAGKPAVYASLAAVSAGLYFKMNMIEIANGLEEFSPPAGRMRLLGGIKNSLLIDDTYNASPQSSLAAIDFIKEIKTDDITGKLAVFGDMLELGSESETGHKQVGKALKDAGFDMVVAVGERARDILRGAKEAGMNNSRLFHFDKNDPAGKFVQKKMKEGNLVLVKGSQGARMEQIVKEIMAEPLRAEELLVRQGREWL
ncbi:hypothetical protein GF382_00600 [Candidatus Falkowbacteria bacterium]|nr:hypothetical protein [Candidatus Falkowbacteria bacterium]